VTTLPSISIITPSYQHAEFIEGTIRSVLDQGYPRLEFQVMDGGSSDGTVEILRRYQGLLNWISEPDGGQAAALNDGFRRTSGEIIGWLNSDDLYAEGALAAVGAYFQANPTTEWLYGRCPIIDRQGRSARDLVTHYKQFWMRRYSYRRLLVENFLNQPAVFFRRRLLERVGLIDTRYRNAFDYELFLRMGAVAHPAYLDRLLAYFRVHREAKTSSSFDRTFREELDAAERVTAGRHPLLIALHRVNRLKLTAAYSLLARLGI
jgi:glycosyltransferase involved in cell wall biosynthesis